MGIIIQKHFAPHWGNKFPAGGNNRNMETIEHEQGRPLGRMGDCDTAHEAASGLKTAQR